MPFIPIGMRQLCLVTGLAIICLSYAAEAYSKPEDRALQDVDFDESSLSLIQKSMHAGKTQQLEEEEETENVEGAEEDLSLLQESSNDASDEESDDQYAEEAEEQDAEEQSEDDTEEEAEEESEGESEESEEQAEEESDEEAEEESEEEAEEASEEEEAEENSKEDEAEEEDEDPGVQASGLKVEHWVDPETIDTDATVDDIDDVVSEHRRMVDLAANGVDPSLAAKKEGSNDLWLQIIKEKMEGVHSEQHIFKEGSNDLWLQIIKEKMEEEGDEALAELREDEKEEEGDEALAKLGKDEKAADVRRADEAANLAKLNEEVLHQLTPTENIYLDTVRDTLTGAILRTPSVRPGAGEAQELQRLPFNKDKRFADAAGTWCDECFTMVGGARLENVRSLVQQTIVERIPGDFLEAGSWRGGCSIMARVVQKVFQQDSERKTWVCDSFSGLPPSSQKVDTSVWTGMKFLEVSQEEVEDNFRNFQALDKNVEFRKGYFSNSLPKLRSELRRQGRQIAVLRGDGDMYESFLDILYNLYEFVPVGGYFICDDCPKIDVSQKAIDEFRAHHKISSPIQTVPGSEWTTYWRKEENTPVDYSWYLNWNATRIYKSK